MIIIIVYLYTNLQCRLYIAIIIIIIIVIRRGITESSPELADVLYQYPAHQQSKLLQVIMMMVVMNHKRLCLI